MRKANATHFSKDLYDSRKLEGGSNKPQQFRRGTHNKDNSINLTRCPKINSIRATWERLSAGNWLQPGGRWAIAKHFSAPQAECEHTDNLY